MSQIKIRPRKRRIIRTFVKTFLIAMGIFVGAFVVALVGLSAFGNGQPVMEQLGSITGGSVLDIFAAEEERVNFLIVGLDDDGTRTDVMMLGTFDPENVSVDLISVPRDIRVTLPDDRYEKLVSEGVTTMRADGTMKLNEVHHHGGSKHGMEYLQLQIEEMLDVAIDFYVKIDLDAFRYIVDEIGGVEFDVPERMYYYDPVQSLLIDLYPGVQMLDGKDAEGLVRYRSYDEADLMRVRVQQAFVKALVEQVLDRENIISNAQTMIMASLKYVETDFDMLSLPKYLKYINTFSTENMHTYTLPTKADSSVGGKSYIALDNPAAANLIDSIFYDTGEIQYVSSAGKTIQVLNGGNESGLAGRGKEVLEGYGFEVVSIGDYSGMKEAETRIFVRDRAYGDDLTAYFSGSKVVYDPTLGGTYDIVVVIGTDGLH